MKKVIMSVVAAFAFITVFIVPAVASAGDCKIIICDSIDPMSVAQSWGLTGYQTPVVANGVTVTDKFGHKGFCNEFWGCFDISKTVSYLSQFSR